jgi:hypothetical protein
MGSPKKPALSHANGVIERACPELVERVMPNDCSFPLSVIPDPIRNPPNRIDATPNSLHFTSRILFWRFTMLLKKNGLLNFPI